MQLALGAIYGWSVFVAPLEQLNGWSRTQVTLTFTIALFVLGIAAFGGGLWVDRRGPRVVGISAGILYGAGVFLAGFSHGNLGLLYASYGVLGGVGLGLGYIIPVATLVRWFPDKRGLIGGIAVAGFGGGGLLTALVAPGLIGTYGVWATFKILGVVYGGVIVLSAGILRRPPARVTVRTPLVDRARATHEFSVGMALRTWQWYALWLILFLNVIPGAAVISVAVPMAQDLTGVSAAAAAGLVISNAVGNVAGRLAWSAISDRVGRKPVFVTMFVVQAVVLLCLPAATSIGLLSVCSFIIMLCNGGGFSTMPAFTADSFGSRHVGQVYGLLLTAWGMAAIAGPLLLTSVFDRTGYYAPALYVFAVAMLAGAAIPPLVRRPELRGVQRLEIAPAVPLDAEAAPGGKLNRAA
jgi:MFS transporter, OFA family, oxalate/formate antiporter